MHTPHFPLALQLTELKCMYKVYRSCLCVNESKTCVLVHKFLGFECTNTGRCAVKIIFIRYVMHRPTVTLVMYSWLYCKP